MPDQTMAALSYFFTDVPYNTGEFTSALIDPQFPDGIVVTAGNNIYKYNYLIDDADLKFRGMPGERFIVLNSVLFWVVRNWEAVKSLKQLNLLSGLKAFMEGPFDGTNLNMNTDLIPMDSCH
ncbi:MAG: hypothetical protein R2764_04290 [Bacteroidales bacterium]